MATEPLLTIGMAVFDDYHGCFFSVQALRLYHPEAVKHCELVVVDNNPQGPHGHDVRNLLGWVRGDFQSVRYHPFTEHQGTAAPRDLLFKLGTAPNVLCLDSHVLLPPGALEKLLEHYRRHPDTNDLFQGPLVYDDLKNYSTHFDDRWDGEMWGKWSTAWRSPTGLHFDVYPDPADPQACRFNSLVGREVLTPAELWGGSDPVPHATHVQELLARGCRLLGESPVEAPFEIPALGLGLFSCRRAAWPGFNPDFRGFGGEEWYIHTKFRQKGHKVRCLPFLRWLHRFGRPGGVPYPLSNWHKVRNYVVGHRELGLDLGPVYDHFVAPGKVTQQQWDAILGGAAEPPAKPACGSCGQKAQDTTSTLEQLYERAAKTPSDINEHVPTLKELASRCEHVTEFGVRTGVSTTGLLAGQPKRLVSYDKNHSPQADGLKRVRGACDYEFRVGDSTQVDIEETDLLFIDTRHTADHLYAELTKHHARVRKWMAFHDTEIFGERGEDGGAGLLPALRKFLKEHTEWTVLRHDPNNHGLTVISKDPADKPALPSAGRQFLNFTKAMAKHLANGLKLVDEDAAQARLDVCALCPSRNDDRCSKCGCWLVERPDGGPGKTLLPTEFCPLGRWHQEGGE